MTASETPSGDTSVSYTGLLSDPRLLSLTLISAVGTFGGSAVSPALPTIATALGVSDANIGLVMTAYTLPQILVIMLVGMLADTYGRRVVLLPALFVFGAAGTAIALVDSFSAILGLRIIQGMVAGGIIPITITVIGDVYTGAVGSAAQGIRLSGNALSSILVPAVAGLLAGIAWYVPFYLFLLAFVGGILGYLYLPETGQRQISGDVLGEIREYAHALRIEITDRNLGVIFAGGFFQGFAWYALLTFVPLFAVRTLDATTFTAGLALSMRGIARIVIAPVTGTVLTAVSRKWALIGSLVVSAAGTALIPLSSTVIWLGLLVGVFGLGDALFTPVHRDTLTQLASEERRAGVVDGMIVFRQIGTTASPVVFGAVLAAVGFDALFVLAGAVFAVYAVVVMAFFATDGR